MRKAKLINRPLGVKAPTGDACQACNGTGVVQGAVSEFICAACGGLGIDEPREAHYIDTADALAHALVAARRDIRELKRINAELHGQRGVGSKID